MRPGGIILGDDFSATIWQHHKKFEPTLVFPFAVYFAEAIGARIYGLGFRQFLIEVPAGRERKFEFIDFTGSYGVRALGPQIRKPFDLRDEIAMRIPKTWKRRFRKLRAKL